MDTDKSKVFRRCATLHDSGDVIETLGWRTLVLPVGVVRIAVPNQLLL